MGWVTILYVAIGALSSTIAGIYLAAWLMQREGWSYLLLAVLAVSIGGLAAMEFWMLHARTPDEYATALRWFNVPIWSGFLALLGLVYLRLRPRFAWLGGLAAGLRTVSLVANFVSGPNLNYTEITSIGRLAFLGESVATASGIPNPWMLTGQASLLLSILFLLDSGVSAWRRGEGLQSLVLVISLLVAVTTGLLQAILVFWGFVQLPFIITPLFLFVAIVLGTELSFGLLRAARAERDVKLKDAALAISEQRLSLAAEAAGAGFWSLDWQSGEVWATAKTRELFGLVPDGTVHLADFLRRVHRRDRARLQRLIEETLGSHDEYRVEFRVVHLDGRVRWLAGWGRSIGKAGDGPRTLMGLTMDISARRALQDRIRRQRVQLGRMAKAATLAELSTALAHELNQPLSMILTNAEAAQALLAQDRPDLSEIREILADIVGADRRAADVIRQLRGLVQRGEPQREALSLGDAIHRVLHLLASEIDDHEITVDLNLAPDLPPVQADRVLMDQVLLNLLDNACTVLVDNPPGERRLSIVTRARGDEVLLEITENGPGVSDPERVFDPFYSTKPGGLGIGLSIVRSIVRSHRGRVWMESAPGHGATVHVSLPVNGGAS